MSSSDQERRLFLLRHAKSSWDEPGLSDHDRPLAARGRRAATLIGEHLLAEQVAPALVLCSSAQRARQTLDLVRPEGRVEIEPELYRASATELMDRLRRVPDDIEETLLIGHNPAIHTLALILARDPGSLAEGKYPTGALATLSFAGSWSELRRAGATLRGFIKPKSLG